MEIGEHSSLRENTKKRYSVWSYVYSELTRGYLLEHDEAKYHEKRERIYNVFKIPVELEKFMTYGFFQCMDAFLYVFTFLPLRFIMAFLKFIVCGSISSCLRKRGRVLEPAQICDMLRGIILIVCYFLMQYVDLSMMYHIIRGQAIIKLYLFFNMLEVADRLFSSFGQDTLDSLFWTATEPRVKRRHHVGLLPHLTLAIVYVFIHGVLVLFQASTLNVAFNSHNKALLTIMMSNNFVELKGSVFKKFEKNNLFQMACSDVRERFHFIVLLAIVCTRNLTEFSWNMDYLMSLIPDVLMVLLSELLVDWVKHAFITKFNEIPATVFKEYTTSIAYDMISIREKNSHSDHLDLVSRRMGFIPLPLAVVLVRVVAQSFKLTSWSHAGLALLFYLCLVSVKVLNSIVLLGKACALTDEAKQSPPAPSSTPNKTKVQSTPNTSPKRTPGTPAFDFKRRLSDPTISPTAPGVQEVEIGIGLVEKSSCLKRTRSLGHKMYVSFAERENSENTIYYSEEGSPNNSMNEFQDAVNQSTPPPEGCEELIRSPSLPRQLFLSNSTVSLDSMKLNEEFIKDTQPAPIPGEGEGTELKHRKPPPKPLHEIDRYTMCSNRIT